MSEPTPTPRTDGSLNVFLMKHAGSNIEREFVYADFARTLERELATDRAAREQADARLAEAMMWLQELKHWPKVAEFISSTHPPPILAELERLRGRVCRDCEAKHEPTELTNESK